MTAERYQTFWRRLLAGFIDGLVLWPVGWLNRSVHAQEWPVGVIVVWSVVHSALPVVYSTVLHWKKGQTVGKWAADIKVLDVREERLPSLRQAFLRDIGYVSLTAVGLILYWTVYLFREDNGADAAFFWPGVVLSSAGLVWFGLEVITMFMDDKRRALHDHIGGTVVVNE
jgi:uncharacterized RDD family membrane protein YckC